MTETVTHLELHEPLASRYADFLAKLNDNPELPAATLQLCRLRIAHIHACTAEIAAAQQAAAKQGISESVQNALQHADFSALSTFDVAALTLAEQVPWQHHAISDADVAAAEQAFGPAATVALLTACAFFDVNCRLNTVLPLALGK